MAEKGLVVQRRKGVKDDKAIEVDILFSF